ncbi:MAG: RidA family protein [Phycisphaerales bacterium]|nr:RidA family protein [Phycisphaerales bacterium]
MKPSERLPQLGLTLPPVPAPVGAYVPAHRVGNLLYLSGQLPLVDGALHLTGKVGGQGRSLSDGQEAARLAALNAVAAAAGAAGSVDAITQVVKVVVYVNSAPGFTEQHKVANGASDLLAAVFGESGRHARAAVGVAELPLDAAVEIDVLFAVQP